MEINLTKNENKMQITFMSDEEVMQYLISINNSEYETRVQK
jgi:hypothetical protein